MKLMKKEPAKKILLNKPYILIGLIILIGLAIIIFSVKHHPTITGYETEDGVVFVCSKPIRAKQGTATGLLGHPQGLIPYNQSDAAKYCHASGIE
jgi:hypothetical protein